METSFWDSSLFNYLVLPLMIFCARIMDVTLDTIRIVMVGKGERKIAPLLGFFEILIWLIAISRIMQNLDNWMCYVFYAAGFATGNYIGIMIEEKLAVGIVQLQIITGNQASELINALKQAGYGITHHIAEGGASTRFVSVIYSIVRRNDLDKVIAIIREYNSDAFYSIADVRFVNKNLSMPIPEQLVVQSAGK
jgi:uncharacterized protein YebE (UPF0316 family)